MRFFLNKVEVKTAAVILKRLKEDGELSTSEIALFLKMCKVDDRPRTFMRKYLRKYFTTKLIEADGTNELVYYFKRE